MGLQKGVPSTAERAQHMTARRQSNVRTGAGTLFGRAAIYARISLDKVGEAAAVGRVRQIDACRHLADLEGWSIDEVLVD